jgi:DNA-binding MarR family transcriptional regulator
MRKMKNEKKLPADLSPLDLKIILEICKQQKVTMKYFLRYLPAKRTCMQKHVKRLVDKGYILKCGSSRETWYEGVV